MFYSFVLGVGGLIVPALWLRGYPHGTRVSHPPHLSVLQQAPMASVKK